MFGQVFICQFPFTSGSARKPRPLLVLFDLGDDTLICRITSVARSGKLDVALSDWREAGLAKPSVARLDRVVSAEKTTLRRQLGALSGRDADAYAGRGRTYAVVKARVPKPPPANGPELPITPAIEAESFKELARNTDVAAKLDSSHGQSILDGRLRSQSGRSAMVDDLDCGPGRRYSTISDSISA